MRSLFGCPTQGVAGLPFQKNSPNWASDAICGKSGARLDTTPVFTQSSRLPR